jgi:hypothetical protein
MTIGFHFQFPIQFVHSLTHSGQTNARLSTSFTKSDQTLRRSAASDPALLPVARID